MEIVWRNGPSKENYEQERTKRLFNTDIPARFPLAIASARREQDVVDAVNLAISKNCRISVRAGGHSYAAWSVRSHAILLDLGDYRECGLDENDVACVSPSVTGRELHDFLLARGRFFPVGHCPDVGVGGYLLGGGMGWNQPNLGWACEHIVAVDVVTAAGERKRADAHQNSDLFWAARGGGPAFPGIVTRFYLRTFPAPGIMRSSGYIYSVEHYSTVFNWALGIAATFEHSIEIVAIGSYQTGIETPCITIALLAFGDDEDPIKTLLQGVENSHPDGAVSHWFCQETNLAEQFEFKAKAYPTGHRWYVDNAFVRNDVDVAAILQPAFTTLPTRKSLALWSSMIPLSRRGLPDMALSLHSDHYFAVYAVWEDESGDSRSRAWVDEIMESVGAQSVGSYLGELDFRSRRAEYWGKEQRTRLTEIRRKWDPANRICGCLGLEGLGLS
ncbi:FAD-binding oxidoreductase [Aspergillus mulundensis]|uniref:FAD-binding PCMH-type domain-containing protein n=1 Tax=Aspergillus mulundensis TaxID=1810919 RepID=A0A3D8T4S9_9EURO|nr:Uncharacterized protein DSM5745_00783 [Aspergillus mulundensis]RDW93461.1 Uncharacterized protein DSM5745_00783 [Aspergillus mulundensis]